MRNVSSTASKMPSKGSLIPLEVQTILNNQFASVGLKFDVSRVDLSKDLRGELRRVRETVELISNNAKLLPTFARELKKAMGAAKKLGKFQADMVREGLKTQLGIDRSHADILLAFAGYRREKDVMSAKLEMRMQKIAAQGEARQRFYTESFGQEQQLLDARWALISDTHKKLNAVKKQRALASASQKNRSAEFLMDAFKE